MSIYEYINIPIMIGKNELTPECAYFLGAIMSADESFLYSDKRYWLAPVRHNSVQSIDDEINEHTQILRHIIGRADGEIFTKEQLKEKQWFKSGNMALAFRSKKGFTAIFESDVNTTIDSFFDDVKDAIDASRPEVAQAFIAGAFDGRSSVDRNMKNNKIRHLVLDCEDSNVASYLSEMLNELEIVSSYNIARERLEGGQPRKNQLRIKGNYVPLFMEKIGLASPLRFAHIRSMLNPDLFVHYNNKILWGLKTLSAIPQIDDAFEFLMPDMQTIEDELDDRLMEDTTKYSAYSEYDVHHIQGDPNFSYSRTPQEKPSLINMNGRETYRRDRRVAINALALADYKCEVDANHPFFIRKNSNLPYSEPHHLVPVAYHKMFPFSLDVEENIISLCSNCHNQLHYGKDIRTLLTDMYEARKDLLHSVGIDVSLQELFKMYNA